MDAPADKIRCDACPMLCCIREGMLDACDRYANRGGVLTRTDPHVPLEHTLVQGGGLVPFLPSPREWDGSTIREPRTFVTAIGAGATYPD